MELPFQQAKMIFFTDLEIATEETWKVIRGVPVALFSGRRYEQALSHYTLPCPYSESSASPPQSCLSQFVGRRIGDLSNLLFDLFRNVHHLESQLSRQQDQTKTPSEGFLTPVEERPSEGAECVVVEGPVPAGLLIQPI